jgi:excisionase family DNA binding protein
MIERANFSVSEAAKWLGVSLRTVYRLAQRGKLPSFKVGGQWRFSRKLLEAWVADQVTVERLRSVERKRKPRRRSSRR